MSLEKGGQRKVLGLREIGDMPQRERARLINSISGFKSANIVGTADAGWICQRAASCPVSCT